MALPMTNSPEFFTTIPSTGQEIRYRPFTVKEQKILLFAVQSNDVKDVVHSIEQILHSCIIDKVDIDSLASFDIEYLFLQIRGKSIGEFLEFKLKHGESNECKHVTDFALNLDDVKINVPEDLSNIVMLTDVLGVTLSYPTLKNIEEYVSVFTDIDAMIKYLTNNIINVFDAENVYDNFSKQEIEDFINQLTTSQFDKIIEWYNALPTLTHTITYTCQACGQEETIVLEGIRDFFS